MSAWSLIFLLLCCCCCCCCDAGRQYLKRVLIWLDQGVNTVLLFGSPDETISARAYRCRWAIYPVIDRLFFWDRDHCRGSWRAEQERAQLPNEYRA